MVPGSWLSPTQWQTPSRPIPLYLIPLPMIFKLRDFITFLKFTFARRNRLWVIQCSILCLHNSSGMQVAGVRNTITSLQRCHVVTFYTKFLPYHPGFFFFKFVCWLVCFVLFYSVLSLPTNNLHLIWDPVVARNHFSFFFLDKVGLQLVLHLPLFTFLFT